MKKTLRVLMVSAALTTFGCAFAMPALADCPGLPDFTALKAALARSITPASGANGGLGFNEWATIVSNDGIVCAVAFSGAGGTSQFLGSRVNSAQKANTANDFSLGQHSTPAASLFPTGLALASANLFSDAQPGGGLFGLTETNLLNTTAAYGDTGRSDSNPVNGRAFGTPADPMVGHRIGGISVIGGGLALFQGGVKVGGVGASGDTACTDHMVAWRLRNALGLDQLQGVAGPLSGFDNAHPDNIIFDIVANPAGGVGNSPSGFGHPTCLNNPTTAAVSGLPPVH